MATAALSRGQRHRPGAVDLAVVVLEEVGHEIRQIALCGGVEARRADPLQLGGAVRRVPVHVGGEGVAGAARPRHGPEARDL
jgi:hypothetical protein